MKNMKVKTKLLAGFLFVATLALIVGFVGIIGMMQISEADTDLYNMNLVAIRAMGNMNDATSSLRMHYRNFVIYESDDPNFKASETAINEIDTQFKSYMDDYQATITEKEDQDDFNEIKSMYTDILMGQAIPQILAAGQNNDTELAMQLMDEYADEIQELDDLISVSVEYNTNEAEASVERNQKLSQTMTLLAIAVIVFAVLIAIALGVYIADMISKPLITLTSFMEQAGATGNIELRHEDMENIKKMSLNKDELGRCIGSTASFIQRLTDVGHTLETVAAGDLTVELALLSEHDVMGVSLKKMMDNLNNMFSEINMSSQQVSTGSKQIADGSQALAQGSTEQASAVEQLSSSIAEIADKTKDNAELAFKAADLANTIKDNAEKGNRQMNEMMDAVKDINQASQSIGKVIKVIDDIAFQTNILALNAAVEAARAGQHGKGFAVVAEEVRNLAAKSAEAAKDTGGLIANSIEKAELGSRIANETAASLGEIVSGINESSKIVGDIAKSSEEQSLGIAQINKGIDQVAQVVQQNSATAEESAAASEEMSGQATMLEELVSRFKIKGDNRSALNAAEKPAAKRQLTMPTKTTHNVSGSGGFGKY